MKHYLIALSVALASPSLLAQVNQNYDAIDRNERELRKVAEQEVAIRKKMTDLQEIAQRVGYLSAWRDQIFLGKSGVKSRVDAWTGRADAWLKSWSMLVELASTHDKTAISGIAVKISDFMRKQSDVLIGLQRDGLAIKSELNLRKAELQQLRVFSPSMISGRDAALRSLMKRQSELQQAFTDLETSFAIGGFETLKARHDAIIMTLDTVFKQRMTEFPELNAAIDSARNLLILEARYRTRVLDLEKRSTDNRRLSSLYAMYVAQKDLDNLRTEVNALTAQLRAERQPTNLSQDFITRAESALKKAQDHWNRLSQTASADFLFIRYMNDRRRIFTRDCRLEETRITRDCELLRNLNLLNIDDESVSKLSASDRLLLQEKLETVAQGPSFVRKNP